MMTQSKNRLSDLEFMRLANEANYLLDRALQLILESRKEHLKQQDVSSDQEAA